MFKRTSGLLSPGIGDICTVSLGGKFLFGFCGEAGTRYWPVLNLRCLGYLIIYLIYVRRKRF